MSRVGESTPSAPLDCAGADIACLVREIVEVRRRARDTFSVRIEAPEIARAVLPGQFVMIRFADREAPLIGRAMAVYDVIDDNGRPTWIDLMFVRKGAFTTPLAEAAPGTRLALWGPLGNRFSRTPCDLLIMAAGGVGETPMLVAAKEALGRRRFGQGTFAGDANASHEAASHDGWAREVRLVYGARTAELLAGVDDFHAAGIDVQLCTDDGSAGTQARVPEYLAQLLDREKEAATARSVRVICCGPEIMMEKVAEICNAREIPCEVSLETPMACGIGICFTCVARVRPGDGGQWDYKRTCVEGPIFDARLIEW